MFLREIVIDGTFNNSGCSSWGSGGNEICKNFGNLDEENSLSFLALQLGWLNNVGVAIKSPEKRVYAFFHPTFEEYFAACAIEDWDFFLPRNHKDRSVAGKQYRIFEPQWKQVMLLWLGREDIEKEDKQQFIEALILDKIALLNQQKVAKLLQVVQDYRNEDDYTRREAVKRLGEIAPGNQQVIRSGNTDRRWEVVESLNEIVQDNQKAEVVTNLKGCLSPASYLLKKDRFQDGYKVIWNCAQTLPYPEFYQAWHKKSGLLSRIRQLFSKSTDLY